MLILYMGRRESAFLAFRQHFQRKQFCLRFYNVLTHRDIFPVVMQGVDIVVFGRHLHSVQTTNLYLKLKRHRLVPKLVLEVDAHEVDEISDHVMHKEIAGVYTVDQTPDLQGFFERVLIGELCIPQALLSQMLAYERMTYGLSDRQRRIFELMRRGMKNAAISELLNVSERTVSRDRAVIRQYVRSAGWRLTTQGMHLESDALRCVWE